jgi:hypothetical protein
MVIYYIYIDKSKNIKIKFAKNNNYNQININNIKNILFI